MSCMGVESPQKTCLQGLQRRVAWELHRRFAFKAYTGELQRTVTQEGCVEGLDRSVSWESCIGGLHKRVTWEGCIGEFVSGFQFCFIVWVYLDFCLHVFHEIEKFYPYIFLISFLFFCAHCCTYSIIILQANVFYNYAFQKAQKRKGSKSISEERYIQLLIQLSMSVHFSCNSNYHLVQFSFSNGTIFYNYLQPE